MSYTIKNNKVNYYNKDFSNIREDLVNYAKSYFPNSGNDFSPASPGMMFIEMAAYIGDLLSFHLDKQVQETFIQTATERENIIQIANMLGYNHKNITPASVTLSVYQVVPSINSSSPNLNYALTIKEGSLVNGGGITFRILSDVNFKLTGSIDSEVDTYTLDGSGLPQYYLLKRKVRASAASLKSETFFFPSDTKPNTSIQINKTDVIEILDVTDSNGNVWYEVPYLAQQTILETVKNDSNATSDLNIYEDNTPYLLNSVITNKKFIKRVNFDNTTQLIFGAGASANADNVIFTNQENINQGFETQDINNRNLDPTNFLYLQANGEVPRDVSVIVRYYSGGGFLSNVGQSNITNIETIEFGELNESQLTVDLLKFVKNSVFFTNEEAAQGGRDAESDEEIKQNALAFFNAQNRCVTAQDYMIRSLSLPSKFGSIAKVFVKKDSQIVSSGGTDTITENPLAINLYCLGYDLSKKFTALNLASKYNLSKYLDFYRMATDAVNIKQAYIINIAVKFEIVVLKNYNQNEVLARCILELKNYFKNDNMQINKPIVISELYNTLSLVTGVQSCKSVHISNKYGGDYSNNRYDINLATKGGILYPAADASIFEIKLPNADIEGKIVNY